jgi:Ca-activated chloride channel homolog
VSGRTRLGLLLAGVLGIVGACGSPAGIGAPGLLGARTGPPTAARGENHQGLFRHDLLLDADELLVIERAPLSLGLAPAAPSPYDDIGASGAGGLTTELQGELVLVPLAHTSVDGEIHGNVAALSVTQRFSNPFDHPIEAVYVFPLPHDAAVTDFLMTVGKRTIRGVVREREEARELYAAARARGLRASLMTQERANVFTQHVTGIAPGGALEVTVEYFNRLAYRDGEYELVFPMVVGPRYSPRGSAPVADGPRLQPDQRSGHDIDLHLELFAGAPIEALTCNTHQLEIQRPAEDRALITLAHFDRLPNRDLVLRYRVSADEVRTSLQIHQTEEGGWMHLTVLPPVLLEGLAARPVEMVFVVDTSGSMQGAPLRQAKAGILAALDRLGPDDTLRVMRFSDGVDEMDAGPLPATPANLERARAFVRKLRANGGTEMMSGLRACLRHPADPKRQRLVTFMTDGYIGNESQVLSEVQYSVADTRIFSFGLGSSPNRFLLQWLAREGGGAAAFLGPDDDAQAVMARYFERLRRPALTELAIDWGGLPVAGVFPTELPDLFVGRPVEVVARLTEAVNLSQASVRVTGLAQGSPRALPVSIETTGPGRGGDALAKLWARYKIADLNSQARGQDGPSTERTAHRIRDLALEYGLLSAYTAFIAVDSMSEVAGEVETVPVPLPLPAGMEQGPAATAKDG